MSASLTVQPLDVTQGIIMVAKQYTSGSVGKSQSVLSFSVCRQQLHMYGGSSMQHVLLQLLLHLAMSLLMMHAAAMPVHDSLHPLYDSSRHCPLQQLHFLWRNCPSPSHSMSLCTGQQLVG